MGFPLKVRESVLLKCKRHCCLCGQYVGTNIELHHIKQKAHGGEDTEDNCIPLCFNCHAKMPAPTHHKGCKYNESELKQRRDEIYEHVKNKPIIIYTQNDINIAKSIMDKYDEKLECLIRIDPCGQQIYIPFIDSVESMRRDLNSYKYQFDALDLDNEKCNIVSAAEDWIDYLYNPEYFHPSSNNLEYIIFNSSTVNQYRDDIKEIRNILCIAYNKLRFVSRPVQTNIITDF